MLILFIGPVFLSTDNTFMIYGVYIEPLRSLQYIEVSSGGHFEFMLISSFPMVQFFGTFILGLGTPYLRS